MSILVKKISNLFPTLGKYKRSIKAWQDATAKEKNSYSQYQDDVFIIEALKDVDKTKGIYIDIGANHPSSISNTYKLYRQGFNGIIIEPNSELVELHKKNRPRDIQIAVGCGVKNEVKKFIYSKTPVLSSFVESEVENAWKTEYLPVYTLDTILGSMDFEFVYLLSIDVEGWDFEVLQGCTATLPKIYLICVEANKKEEEDKINAFMMANNFELIHKKHCNLFYKNKINHTMTSA